MTFIFSSRECSDADEGGLACLQEFVKLFDDDVAFHHTAHEIKRHLPKS